MILLMALPDLYIERHFLKRRGCRLRWRILWWIPSMLLLLYTLALCFVHNFEPSVIGWVNLYLFLFGVIVIPKVVFALFSLTGWCVCRLFHSHINLGNVLGLLGAVMMLHIVIYGSFFGLDRLEVRQEVYSSPDLPPAFDGYRIVHFSDAHVGTFTASHQDALRRAVDSINAQKADVILFTGDLIDLEPSEVYPYINLLSTLHACDGVYSVMGNHDYPMYMKSLNCAQKAANLKELKNREVQFGWNLLLNEHSTIHRGQDSIIIAGEENDGRPPFPSLGNARATMKNVSMSQFVVMLQHDPTAWRSHILRQTIAQLTLSGHTHAMQFKLLGWSPSSLMYREWGGMFYQGRRALNVSTGLGGVIPFRFGAWPEIVVITLHRTK